MAKFRGSKCLKDCGGHRAGYSYYMGGGRKKNPKAPSFNKGMKIGVKALKARNKRKRK